MTRVLAAPQVAAMLGHFDRTPAYKGLAEGLRVLITDGRIPVGTRLPSERALTHELAVSRTTVTRAYAELRDRSFVASRQGSGSVVALPESLGAIVTHVLHPGDSGSGAIDLTVAAPAPGAGLLAAYERATVELPDYLVGTGYHPTGLPVLREAIADSYAARGLPTTPDQVLVVPGAQAGVATAVRALFSPRDRVLTESPTYPNAIATMLDSGLRVTGADVAPDAAARGYDITPLLAALRQLRPRGAYLVPDFHNPTGALMSDQQREQVAACMARTRTAAIVDESLVALPLDGQHMPAPFGIHSPAAISVGSMSKPYWGGLRIGWLRVPPEHVDEVFRARLTLDLGAAPLEQLVAADLLRHGAELLDQRRVQLRASRDALLAAVDEELPEWRVSRPGGGLNLWCELPAALSSSLVPRAAAHGVLLAPGPGFAPEGGLDRFVRLPFSQPAPVLVDAAARIAEAWRETVADPDRISRPVRRSPGLVA